MMGECYCSNIAIMQLFHELKQQFPALPDHVVSQCIAQNSHDRETCAQSLRATQDSRPSPGAFPPPAPDQIDKFSPSRKEPIRSDDQRRGTIIYHRATSLNGANTATSPTTRNTKVHHSNVRAHRPVSLDIGRTFGNCQYSQSPNVRRRQPLNSNENVEPSGPVPTSAPPTFYPTRGFFDDLPSSNAPKPNAKFDAKGIAASIPVSTTNNNIPIDRSSIVLENTPRNHRGGQSASAGFELNVNVACSPTGNRDFRTVPPIGAAKRSDLVVEPRPHYAEPRLAQSRKPPSLQNHHQQQQQQQHPQPQDSTRSYTSVSLTLRPPSSEPQAPIDIRSQGSSLTYSTSSLDPRGFQSRLQISIGPGSVGSVASARIRPPMAQTRPNSLIPHIQAGPERPPGLPSGPPSQLPRPTTTMSAPTTPSAPTIGPVHPTSLPTTPSTARAISSPPVNFAQRDQNQTSSELNRLPLNQVAENQKLLVAEQLMRKERLAKELRAEKGRLEAMKRELQSLMRPLDSNISPEDVKRNLISEIYQLQLECDRLADEVDKRSDPRVPLGETNEEFYQGIYTGQSFAFNGNYVGGVTGERSPEPPPLPSRPPVWQLPSTRVNSQNDGNTESRRDNRDDENWDERDGPSWVCRMCTFDNHPLMDKCEQCDMPRLLVHDAGETQDIHIRVTHHHTFPPRRTIHSWVV